MPLFHKDKKEHKDGSSSPSSSDEEQRYAKEKPMGRYFLIESRQNGLCLEVRADRSGPGSPVIMARKQQGHFPAQLWYEDILTGTIRCKLNDFCLDVDEDLKMVVNPYNTDSTAQQWMIHGRRLKNRRSDVYMELNDGKGLVGANVIATDSDRNDPDQQWNFIYKTPRFFYIRSKMNGKVLDINKGKDEAGGKVIVYKQKDNLEENQLWYEDRRGILRSKLFNFCLDAPEVEEEVKTSWPTPGKALQLWRFDRDRIVNVINPKLCLDIKKANKKDGAEVVVYEFKHAENQLWSLDYVDF